MTTKPKLDQEVNKRKAIKLKVTSFFKQINNHDTKPLDTKALTRMIEELDKFATSLDIIQNSIYEECIDDDHIKDQVEIALLLREDILAVKDNAAIIIESLSDTSTPTSIPNVKLPKIELPIFDGSYENWTSFQDLFIATIENNKSLSGAQKLQYLKSTVKGEPANLIKAIQVTDPNYKQAWSMLTDRYENQREIVSSLLRRLFGQPHLSKESAAGLQKLLDTTNECVRTLGVMGRSVSDWDDVLVFLLVERMDNESRRHWAMTLKGTDMPTFKSLQVFLDQHIRGLQAGGSTRIQISKVNNSSTRNTTSVHHGSTTDCPKCKGDHPLYQCKEFLSSSVSERSNIVKRNKLCYNCLKGNHGLRDCKSNHKCKKCNGRHNTLIHLDKNHNSGQHQSSSSSLSSASESNEPRSTQALHSTGGVERQVLLSTALVKVKDSMGTEHVCRVLLDNCSEATFISDSCVRILGLKRKRQNVLITGIGATPSGTARGLVELELASCVSNSVLNVEALILPRITGNRPKFQLNANNWKHIKNLQLADPDFHKPSGIDILLGADYYASILKGGIRSGLKNQAIAQETVFGWILSGSINSNQSRTVTVNHADCEEILKKFWELEDLPSIKHLTPEEKQCEQHFMQTHQKDSSGRYVVNLPFNDKVNKLGLSREAAVKRLKQVENRLAAHPDKKQQYCDFMKDFEVLHHMQRIPESELNQQQGNYYYLPHHCVIKESSSTTKLRVVFDGSAKTTSGLSLNECMLVGPTVQSDLITLLLRFRTHIIALKADIAKFYRQFQVAKEHCNYQRIVWRNSSSEPIQDYRLVRVTYGTAAAPYLATRCLNQLAKDEERNFPETSKVIISDFYVDDLLSGASSSESAIKLKNDITKIIQSAGMDIRKWSSNDSSLLHSISAEDREQELPLSFDRDQSIKTLGVQWQAASDQFMFSVSTPIFKSKITKRIVLSELAKVFDPLGLISPTTVQAKILFQDLWKLKIDWDQELPEDVLQRWTEYQAQLKIIQDITIPRCVTSSTVINSQLHGFCDASEKAYAAVVYHRGEMSDGSFIVRLITSKTKVAPIQQQSIPRLELCGAVMLSKLLTSVKRSINITCETFAWTDSTIVLRWLASFPSRWKTFVANRVAEIQELIPAEHWHHVSTESNPADCASRGISPTELKNLALWWNGPEWLTQPSFPLSIVSIDKDAVEIEEKAKVVLTNHLCLEPSLLFNFSNLTKLKRVSAYCLRFLHNCNKKNASKLSGELTCGELENALNHWIRHIQSREFASELKSLTSTKQVALNSKLSNLYPYIDSSSLLRVGGRLQNSSLPEYVKHQIILPSHHHLTKLIINHHHLVQLHAGTQLLLATLQQQYWIIRARDSIRNVIRKCIVCRRQRAATAQQLMGSLPSPRVTPGRAFLNCGVDYAGPFNLKVLQGRGNKQFKAYICLFVCLATKAIHLEPVSELTTNAFIASLRRFVSRRGICSNIYSDCGTNFVGADKELKNLLQSSQHNTDLSQQLSTKGISWHFNPPGAPHHGGLWEAGVKSVKYHLKRVLGSSSLNFEDFQTLLCQIEACLNSRPLCALSEEPAELKALTPGHFLIGEPLNSIPEPDFTETKVNRLSRWQYTQQLFQHFWKRWSTEYLTSLQQRFKWKTQRDNIQVHDLVLIKDESQPPTKWKLGRVSEVHFGKDNQVRVATVKTTGGELKRPITKLCPLLQD